jgi:hypothetical protein
MNTDPAAIFENHIREHAVLYFPGFFSAEQINVQLIDRQNRRSAVLYWFKVKAGTQNRSLIVKMSTRNSRKGRANILEIKKPLLFPLAEETEMHSLQYTALVTIHEYFISLNKKELGTIRVLDYLPDFQAIVMEESKDPKLQQLLFRESRLRSIFPQNRLTSAFHNAGMWLRIYHKMPKKEQVEVRHEHRDDYIDGIAKLTDFVASRLGDDPFLNQLALILTGKAREILPETLPMGLGHGDYAMRNILVGPNSCVTVLDTFAKWQTPIYEDIGYFLTGMKMTYPQVASQGLMFSPGRLRAYEHAFLKGYFAQKPIPYPTIRLYEMLALLDKWSSLLIPSHKRIRKLKGIGDAMTALASLYFKRSAKQLLQEITGVNSAAPSLDAKRSY